MTNTKHTYLFPIVLSAFLIIGASAILGSLFKPPIQVVEKFLPINPEWSVSERILTNDFHAFKLEGCSVINSAWVPDAIVNREHLPKEDIQFTFLDTSDPEGTFPAGYIYIGGIAWKFKNIPTTAVTKVGLHGAHDCSVIGGSSYVPSTYWWGVPTAIRRTPLLEHQKRSISLQLKEREVYEYPES